MTYLLILGGIALLAIGGDILVRGAVGLSRRLGVSPLLAGLTIVGFGTSTPELVTSINAALAGSPGIAVGNVVGSNIANIMLILGVSALIMPLAVTRKAFTRDGAALILSALACTGAVLLGSIDRLVGALLIAALAGYILWAFLSERTAHDPEAERHEQEAEDVAAPTDSLLLLLAFAGGGIAAAIFGADLLVRGAVELARGWGVSETLIGLTVVAIGTSLPELVACVAAALRRHGDVALGNVIGSNIYNICGILGATALVQPLVVPPEIIRLDIWVMLGVSALLLALMRTGWKIGRVEGGVFVTLYAGYLALLASTV